MSSDRIAGCTGTPGTVFLVGAGPGDPELATVKAVRLIETAEVIVHDRLGTHELLGLAPPECVLINAGKAPGCWAMTQEAITGELIRRATSGRDVVRLKGGDPLIFGRGGEEALALAAAGIPVEIVPGVSSALGAAAQEAIPLTHREIARSVTFVSGHDDPVSPAALERWRALAGVPGTLVLLMAMGNLDGITEALIAGGRSADEPAAAVHAVGSDHSQTAVATLATIADRCRRDALSSPAVVIIGPVVAVRGSIRQIAMEAAVTH